MTDRLEPRVEVIVVDREWAVAPLPFIAETLATASGSRPTRPASGGDRATATARRSRLASRAVARRTRATARRGTRFCSYLIAVFLRPWLSDVVARGASRGSRRTVESPSRFSTIGRRSFQPRHRQCAHEPGTTTLAPVDVPGRSARTPRRPQRLRDLGRSPA
jgi:hypothetical protein